MTPQRDLGTSVGLLATRGMQNLLRASLPLALLSLVMRFNYLIMVAIDEDASARQHAADKR